ncbi:hypothetical protein E4U42_004777 [Claviceps africana]|uniref:UBC core domain-containing protein n=1 Tax=Claviceps africana TaxID=83212 RepID=A0A8K0J560_9HYPO|nr:hypothetical protein E4U42_004777 [Claviceps africana]
MAQKRLMRELQALEREIWVHVEADDRSIMRWKVGLWVVNPDSVWYGAYLRAEMKFPSEYPYQPPTFKFLTKGIHHPNVYTDGNVCISILHKPGDDEQSGELASERWNVLHGVESVLRSVLILMDDPEINSPANVDASKLYRDHRQQYNLLAKGIVEKSQQEVPQDVRMPALADMMPAPTKVIEEDADFWNISDEEQDFGGSDSDEDAGDLEEYDDDEDDDDDDDADDDVKQRA